MNFDKIGFLWAWDAKKKAGRDLGTLLSHCCGAVASEYGTESRG